jgi:putative two-component system response regulator
MDSKNHGRPVQSEALRDAKLLIVDDEEMNVLLLDDMLEQAGYRHILCTSDSCDTLALCRAFSPDLILLDMMMPKMDGVAVMEQLKVEYQVGVNVPILMLTADNLPQTRRRALANGAKDFLTKPFDAVELLQRITNLLETRFLYMDLQRQNVLLEDRVRLRTAELESARQRITDYARELEETQIETLERLARAGEFRDDDTGHHTRRVGETTALLARRLGFSSDRVRWLQQAARLHDVGKIGISDRILLKAGPLSDEEVGIMRAHAMIGAELLQGGQSELFQMAQRIAASHHEHWDGNGYPQGLRGEEIPLEARIVALADVFDALTHDRPYKAAWTVDAAVSEIGQQSGRRFDPGVVEEFLRLPHESLL